MTDIRLAAGMNQRKLTGLVEEDPVQPPNLRMAVTPGFQGDNVMAPHVRLAHNAGDGIQELVLNDNAAPSVRLAGSGGGSGTDNQLRAPSVRMATAAGTDQHQSAILIEGGHKKPDLRLAYTDGGGKGIVDGKEGINYDLPKESWPSILVSFVYLKPFLERQSQYRYREWVLDSGAFSAHMGGKPIDNLQFMETCDHLLDNDPTLKEIFALDVIGDEKASLKNCEACWERGIPAIPTYHFGEPWDYLEHIAANYPKIALGGVALAKTGKKKAWALECFRRIWPKKVHGFAFCGETQVLNIPFHSVDASSWAVGALKFGQWKSLGKLSIRGSKQNLRAEIEHYLKLERRARSRWAKEMKILEELEPTRPIYRGASQP